MIISTRIRIIFNKEYPGLGMIITQNPDIFHPTVSPGLRRLGLVQIVKDYPGLA